MASKSASTIDQLEWQLERLKLINVESAGVTVGRGSYGRVIKVHGTLAMCCQRNSFSFVGADLTQRTRRYKMKISFQMY